MTESQKEFLRQRNIDYDFDNLSEDEANNIVDFAMNLFQIEGFTGDKVTEIGLMCEQIIDWIEDNRLLL